jgi:hypothetical protein
VELTAQLVTYWIDEMRRNDNNLRLISRYLIVIFLSINMSFNLMYSSSSSEIAGTNCSKIGITKKVQNIKYVCEKISGKLIWRNPQIKILPSKQPKPIGTSSPLASPTPSIINPVTKKLTLLPLKIENSSLRLELDEDVYLGHCASYIVYDWGIADTYEGVYYRQRKEYLIPLGTFAPDDLPRIFTFQCQDYSLQSYAIDWKNVSGKLTPSATKLEFVINKSNYLDKIPVTTSENLSGEIRVLLPKTENVSNSLIPTSDGRFKTQTAITYFATFKRDICSSSIVDLNGTKVEPDIFGPGVGTSYSQSEVKPSGFDRLNSIGYLAYSGFEERKLLLQIVCKVSGKISIEFTHPAPQTLLAVIESGPCPGINKGEKLPSLKDKNLILTCTEVSSNVYEWKRDKATESVNKSTSSPSPSLAIPSQDIQMAKLKALNNLALKSSKYASILKSLKQSEKYRNFTNSQKAELERLLKLSTDIQSYFQSLSLTSELTGASKVMISFFNDLEESYFKLIQ